MTQLLNSVHAHEKIAKSYIQSTWADVVVLAAQGLIAYIKRDWSSAIAKLEVALPRLHEVGGSHAQRHVFEQVYRDALIHNPAPRTEQSLELVRKHSDLEL